MSSPRIPRDRQGHVPGTSSDHPDLSGRSAMDSKLAIVRSLGPERCVSIGNGRNDCLMCKESALSISVIGEEGAYSKLLSCTDLCTTSILDALALLEKPKRLVADLRG